MGEEPVDPNRRHYQAPEVVQAFARRSDLFPAEAQILKDLSPRLRGQPLLDLGVGAGRTTPHLLSISEDYLGVDYSPEMVDRCRGRFPGVRFEVGDARDLSPLAASGRYALVLFSFNGIDYVDQAGRRAALSEISRVLRPGGFFVFSSHNNRRPPAGPLGSAAWPSTFRIRSLAGFVRDTLANLRDYSRNHALQSRGEDYSLLLDDGNRFRALTYYVSPRTQREQLGRLGFEDVALWDSDRAYEPDGSGRGEAPWIYYSARKATPGAIAGEL